MGRHFILEGHEAVPCDLMTWARFFEGDVQKRVVAKDEISDTIKVSTVFLGLDHSWEPGGPPLIFETMVFGGPDDTLCERWSSWDEAVQGHARILAEQKAKISV